MIVVPGGVTVQLTATINSIGGLRTDVTTSSFWSSSNEAVATVNQAGLVTVLGSGPATPSDDRMGWWTRGGDPGPPTGDYIDSRIPPASIYTLTGTVDNVDATFNDWRYWFFVPDYKLSNDVINQTSNLKIDFMPVPAAPQGMVTPDNWSYYGPSEKLWCGQSGGGTYPWFRRETHPDTGQMGFFVGIDKPEGTYEFAWEYSYNLGRAILPGELFTYGPFVARILFGSGGEGWSTYGEYTFETPFYFVGVYGIPMQG